MIHRSHFVLATLAGLVAGVNGAMADCPRGTVTGEVTYIRDGDTIELGALAIRLQGLAAPEGEERGGAEASDAMRALVLGNEVVCELDGDRTYDRCVAICTMDGADIAEAMGSLATARDFSGGRYEAIEMQAAAQGSTIGETYRLPGYCRKR